MLEDLERYLSEGFHKVQGWVSEPIWEVLAFLDHCQRQRDVRGGVCEIGVHHGRFFFGLQALKSDEEFAVAIDVFDQQEFNLDGSGKGNKEIFLANAKSYSTDASRVLALQADSLTLRKWDVAQIRERYGRFSLFSVDGGHTSRHALHDFNIAQELTSPGGLIIVDDYNNPSWPGVQEGIAEAFILERPTFVPLLCGMNKLILTDIGHHESFLKSLTDYFEQFPEARPKLCPRYGWNSLTLALPNNRTPLSTLKQSLPT